MLSGIEIFKFFVSHHLILIKEVLHALRINLISMSVSAAAEKNPAITRPLRERKGQVSVAMSFKFQLLEYFCTKDIFTFLLISRILSKSILLYLGV